MHGGAVFACIITETIRGPTFENLGEADNTYRHAAKGSREPGAVLSLLY